MLKKYKKQIANAVFLIVLLIITFTVLLDGQELTQIFGYMKRAKKLPLIVATGFVIIFACSESLIIYYLMDKLDSKVSILHCIKYSFIGFFYSAVTPSATGGQPMQVFYMKRDKLNVAESTLVLIIITLAYKIVLIILGIIAIFTNYDIIRENLGGVRYLLMFGIAANIIFITFLLVILFRQSFAKKIIFSFILWLGRHKIIRKSDKLLKKAILTLSKYDNCADYIKRNTKVFTFVFLITFIQRISLFLTTFMVYKSFGLHGASMQKIVALQTMIALAADSLPLPGGIGVSESSFIIIFDCIFGSELVIPGMLLSRGLSYYLLLIISAVITFGAHIFVKRKKEWGNL